mmetsp:Transcript_5189/g.8728  ORF Transcript_5189/g.8728 Transcript_5189/m.8728 type:complete len:194 (-) Transcript_5189:203-784(-)|eukprot:CAMPEP_0197058012 /NCGR_PEP_ID=MMETSP1384-20130603/103086_1 /TAXON_ID=29189 /ORGANISM="Ammonia sp." /LENGTH=193 /DNA_ID=CAMNT_0042492617 /DNA_START=14 /DNA_END=595 /DNA_ORIENTATION=+
MTSLLYLQSFVWVSCVFLLFHCHGGVIIGNSEGFNVPLRSVEASDYCHFVGNGLASFDDQYAVNICRQSSEKQCIVQDGEHMIVMDVTGTAVEKKAVEENDNCRVPWFICNIGSAQAGDSRFPNEMEDGSGYSDYTSDYDKIYGYDPELVCMQYQYYVVISTLIMVCFATFICMTIIILNKIKDHQTIVHIRL